MISTTTLQLIGTLSATFTDFPDFNCGSRR